MFAETSVNLHAYMLLLHFAYRTYFTSYRLPCIKYLGYSLGTAQAYYFERNSSCTEDSVMAFDTASRTVGLKRRFGGMC